MVPTFKNTIFENFYRNSKFILIVNRITRVHIKPNDMMLYGI